MAYVNKETTKAIREALKKQFPDCRFSVSKDSSSISLNVSIMKSPFWPDMAHELGINHYHIDSFVNQGNLTEEQGEFLKKVDEIIRIAGNHFDNSDLMVDYFHTAFYYHISVGKYGKPHQFKGA